MSPNQRSVATVKSDIPPTPPYIQKPQNNLLWCGQFLSLQVVL